MKVCKLWLPALILGLIGSAALISDVVFNGTGRGFFLSSGVCAAIFVFSLAALLIIGFVMSGMSRKTGLESTAPGRNPGAGVFGFIASVAIIGSAVIGILSFSTSDSQLAIAASAILSLFGGVVLLYESCISFTGHNGMVKRPMLSFGPILWCCGRLVLMFINYQRISLYASVKYDIFSTALLLMFLFYHAMYLSQPEKPVALRRMTLYGIIYIACAVAVCGDLFTRMIVPVTVTDGVDSVVVEPTVSRILSCICDLSLACYAGFFIIGAHKNSVYTLIEDETEDGEEDPDTVFLGSLSSGKNENETGKTSGGIVIENETGDDKKDEADTAEGSIDSLFRTASAAALAVDDQPTAEEPVIEAAPETNESVIADTASETKESVPEEAAPETNESVTEEAAPETNEPVTEEAAPAAYEAAKQPIAENVKAYAPETDLIGELSEHAKIDEQKELDEMFSGSDEDYDELFRILDEMSAEE